VGITLGRIKSFVVKHKIISGVLVLLALSGTANALHPSQQSAQPPASDTGVKGITAPKTETKVVTETQVIPYQSTTENDVALESGKTTVATTGVNGEKTLTYNVTYTDGKETSRDKPSEKVTKEPINQVTKVGTKVAAPKPIANCDSNYSGACVPIASDVDCAGGSGNGPAYAQGPVTVVGSDIYGLDRDGNGIGCE